MAATLTARSNCIDVGANFGGMLADMVRLAPEGEHYAFEPIPQLADALRERHPDVRVATVALAATSGRAEFQFVPDNPGLSGLSVGKAGDLPRATIEVTLARLDDVLPTDYLPTLIKVDVEGAELGVFEGAVETLLRARPVLVFEHSRNLAPHFNTEPRQVHELLTKLGYRLFDLDGTGPYDLTAFEIAFRTHARFNWLARA